MRFWEIKFETGEVLLPVTQFSSVSIILPLLRTHLNLKIVQSEAQARRPQNTTGLFRISGGGGHSKDEGLHTFFTVLRPTFSEITPWVKILLEKG
jgi:hypothetical protein